MEFLSESELTEFVDLLDFDWLMIQKFLLKWSIYLYKN